MKLYYLPIDSRPCNSLFPVQLLRCAGIDCITPAPDKTDYFTRPAAHSAVADFLNEAAAEGDVLILSADKLVYGSLLASREDNVTADEALLRLKFISKIKGDNPRLSIIAFNTLLRSSTSTLKEEDVIHHHNVTAYSQARHHAVINPSEENLSRVRELEEMIPARILNKYLLVRKRNYIVNQACAELAGSNTFERLLFLQEDSQPYGLHRLEQEPLMQSIKDIPAGRVVLHNGTDEGGCLCAAYAVSKPLKLHVHALGGADLAFTAKYEDRPFIENIKSHARFANIDLVPIREADKILCVLTPNGAEQRDALHTVDETAEEQNRFAALANELAGVMKKYRKVGLLDVCYANGGSVTFCEELAKRVSPLSLAAYSAWNTASNSLGTVLAQLSLGNDGEKNTRFTTERFLDDLIYQSAVRDRLQRLLAGANEDPYCLKDKKAAEELLVGLMNKAVSDSGIFKGFDISAEYALPWPRTFEISVKINEINRGFQ